MLLRFASRCNSELFMSITFLPTGQSIMSRRPPDAEARAREIVEKLGGVWHGNRGECRCPAHDDTTPSLSVRLGDRAILFHCFAGCEVTDVLKALQSRKLHDRLPVSMPEAKPKRDMGALALRLWKASLPVVGTLAEEYLLARGLSGPFPRRSASTPRPSTAPVRPSGRCPP